MSMDIELVEYDVLVDVASGRARALPPCPPDFFGRSVREDLTVSAEVFVNALHPDDLDIMLRTIEELANLPADEVHTYEARFRHVAGPYVRVQVTSKAIETTPQGIAKTVVSHIKAIEVLPEEGR